jgi:transposase
MESTTDLYTIRKHPNSFTWGRVEKIYDLTDYYTIVEYLPSSALKDGVVTQFTQFHVYVEGKDTCRSSTSIEGAMLVAIAYGGFTNKNTADEMARASAKLLEIEGV